VTASGALVARPGAPPGTSRAVRSGRWTWWRSGRRRAQDLRRPVHAVPRLGRRRFPGTAADAELHEGRDAYDRPFALVLVPDTGHASLVLDLRPPVADLLPGDAARAWTGDLRRWLAGAADDPELAGCAVSLLHAGAAPAVTLQLTYVTRGPQARTDPAALAVELGSRLPHLAVGLARHGVGTARPVGAADLLGVVDAAYDPAREPSPPGDPAGSRWSDAASRDVAAAWDRLRHASGASITWSLERIPPDAAMSGVLSRLVAPGPDDGPWAVRARLTLLHRPVRPGRSATPPSDRDDWTGLPAVALRPGLDGAGGAGGAADEDAAGGGARDETGISLSPLLTVTVARRPRASGGWPGDPGGQPDEGADEALDAVVERVLTGVAPSLRPWLRPLYGAQAAGFAAAVPSGTLLGVHTAAPVVVREGP